MGIATRSDAELRVALDRWLTDNLSFFETPDDMLTYLADFVGEEGLKWTQQIYSP